MFPKLSKKQKQEMELPDDQKQLLREQRISENEPGTILRDFETMIDFIGSQTVETSGKYNLFPQKFLKDLNERLSKPLNILLQRPVQKSYPNINGLYLLARTMGVAFIEKQKSKSFLKSDQEALQTWSALNPTEKYFALLEAWMVRSSLETIGERHELMGTLFNCNRLFELLEKGKLMVAGKKEIEQYTLPFIGFHNIALMEMFGWIDVIDGKPQKGKGWMIKEIRCNNFGIAMTNVLKIDLFSRGFSYLEDEEELPDEGAFDTLKKSFEPYFPELKNVFTLTTQTIPQGIFIFKVSLGKNTWRRISIPSEYSLDSLSDVILKAFDFDYDHLYEFVFRNRFGAEQRVAHPACEEYPATSEFTIGELPLSKGDTMVYHYDFGDDWRFKVEVEEIKSPSKKDEIEILEEHGKAPSQYRDWDDDDDDDDDDEEDWE